jgi:hypothetical protein
MDDSGNGDPNYEVYCSGRIAKAIREVHQQALDEGRGAAMLEAFRQAVLRLRQNPKNFGEPLYHLPALRMQVRTALIRPIALDFAVCTDRPLVFIKGVILLDQ